MRQLAKVSHNRLRTTDTFSKLIRVGNFRLQLIATSHFQLFWHFSIQLFSVCVGSGHSVRQLQPAGRNGYDLINGELITPSIYDGVSFIGDGLNLSEVDLALANPQPGFTSLTVEVVGSSSGAPNITNVLESWSVAVVSPSPPGQYFALTSVLDPLLANGTQYWVVSRRRRTAALAYPMASSPLAMGGYSNTTDGGPPWISESFGPTPVLHVEAVPEPDIWALVLGGVGVLIAFQRARSRGA